MRRSGRLAAIALAAVLATSCGHRAADTRRAFRVGVERLAGESLELRGRSDALELPESEWPPALRSLDPLKIRVAEDGVYLVLHEFFVTESGIYVAFPDSNIEVGEGNDPAYFPISGSVYWYKIES